jgi:predicted transcriptional regulator
MNSLKSFRTALAISQSKLARLSGVSRFKICTFELGGGYLTADEQHRISIALTREAARLGLAAAQVNVQELEKADSA